MDSSREYRNLKFINTVVAQSLSIIANILLTYFVTFHSSKLLLSYKKILYLTIICNLASSISGVCLQTTLAINYPVAYLIPEGILGNLSPTTGHIGLVITCFFMNFDVAILPVQYIYRYILLCHKRSLTLTYFLALCVIAAIIPGVVAFGYVTGCWPDENFNKFAQFLNKPEWLLPNGQIPGFVACYFEKLDFTHIVNNIMFIIVYVIIIYCSIMVLVTLRRLKKTTSTHTQKVQTQITFILIIQALLPLLIQVFPQVASSFFATMSPQMLSYFNTLLMFVTAWAPLTSPICTMLIIGSYRSAMIKYCQYLVGGKKTNLRSEAITVISKNNNNLTVVF